MSLARRVCGPLLTIALAAIGLTPAGCGCTTEARLPVQTQPQTGGRAAAEGVSRKSLNDALKLAHEALDTLQGVQDYSCEFIKQERVSGELLEPQRLSMKVRHEPFSIYLGFISPDSYAGQEAIYVAGDNDGKLIGHPNGIKAKIVGRLSLDPNGFLAMMDNRYPITDAGLKKLLIKLIDLGEQPGLLDGARVRFIEDEKIDDRPCTCVEIHNPTPKPNFRLADARIWLDNEYRVPVQFESTEWPEEEGAEPHLVERYTYVKLKLNPGLTDLDFDPDNPAYEYP